MEGAVSKSYRLFSIILFSFLFVSLLQAAENMPPANVVVSPVTSGMINPEEEFVGTVYYPEVSDVSAEVNGTVQTITFEEGQKIKKGGLLVKLDSDLLEKSLLSKTALYEETLSALERARKDFERTVTLYKKNIIAEKDYDDQAFLVKGLEKKSASLKADVDRLTIEVRRTVIMSPFDGVVIKRNVSRGEWLSPGRSVATIARNNVVDVIVEVPERIIRYVTPEMIVSVSAGGNQMKGKLHAVIPKGDIATRTFPLKIRIDNGSSLMEGMAAWVKLPAGKTLPGLLVPRDAILNMAGRTVVVAVIDGKASILPVTVTGYTRSHVGIHSQKISKGMNVVIKGNERLREGQPVAVIKEVE